MGKLTYSLEMQRCCSDEEMCSNRTKGGSWGRYANGRKLLCGPSPEYCARERNYQ